MQAWKAAGLDSESSSTKGESVAEGILPIIVVCLSVSAQRAAGNVTLMTVFTAAVEVRSRTEAQSRLINNVI